VEECYRKCITWSRSHLLQVGQKSPGLNKKCNNSYESTWARGKKCRRRCKLACICGKHGWMYCKRTGNLWLSMIQVPRTGCYRGSGWTKRGHGASVHYKTSIVFLYLSNGWILNPLRNMMTKQLYFIINYIKIIFLISIIVLSIIPKSKEKRVSVREREMNLQKKGFNQTRVIL